VERTGLIRALAGAAAGLLCVTAAPARADCTPPAWVLAAGAEHSDWQERDAAGRALLREQGTLATLVLDLGFGCRGVDWRVALGYAQGRRAYQGLSSTGAAVATASGIERHTLALGGLLPLGGRWSTGARVGYRQLRRDIADAGAVLGYAERFTDWQAAVALRRDVDLGSALVLGAELWLGGGPPGRVALQLPHTDPAVLPLGASRLLEFGLVLRASTATAALPRWSARLNYRRERFAAGPAQALWHNGVLAGGALQPLTHRSALGLQLGASW
jgi:hypothetical protein